MHTAVRMVQSRMRIASALCHRRCAARSKARSDPVLVPHCQAADRLRRLQLMQPQPSAVQSQVAWHARPASCRGCAHAPVCTQLLPSTLPPDDLDDDPEDCLTPLHSNLADEAGRTTPGLYEPISPAPPVPDFQPLDEEGLHAREAEFLARAEAVRAP